MSQKLHTIVALVQGKKKKWDEFVTRTHHSLGAGGERSPLNGLSRVYQPKAEDGENLPSENKIVQIVAKDVLGTIIEEATAFYNLIGCQELSNCTAKADVKVGNKVLVKNAPVGFLMFLEKQLVDLRTFIGKIPVLPVDRIWTWDDNKRCYVAATEEKIRTTKEQEPVVLFPATAQHPAQTQMITKDRAVGMWRETHMSGAMPAQTRERLLKQVEIVREAVVIAREEANSIDTKQEDMVGDLIKFVFDGFEK